MTAFVDRRKMADMSVFVPGDSKESTALVGRFFKTRQILVRNRCYPSPCHNEGHCTETVTGFECTCAVGFKGRRCAEKNYCLPNPCMNDGICNESPDGYVCTCGQGFQGKSCEGFGFPGERTINGNQRSDIAVPSPSLMACLNNPCMNDGLCRPDPTTERGFKCVCISEYKGVLCEEKTCKCENNGFCVTQGLQSKCICKAGYAGDQCEKHTQCNDDTCMHGGLCIEEIGSFKCKCEDGYKGLRCEVQTLVFMVVHAKTYVIHINVNAQRLIKANNVKISTSVFQILVKMVARALDIPVDSSVIVQTASVAKTVKKSCTVIRIHAETAVSVLRYLTASNVYVERDLLETPVKFKTTVQAVLAATEARAKTKETASSALVLNILLETRVKHILESFCSTGILRRFLCIDFTKILLLDPVLMSCKVFNECIEKPCMNGGKCEMRPHGGYKCSCTLGFAGPHCEQIDECQPNPCKSDGICTNNPNGGFSCGCKEGFRGLTCAEPDPCHPNPCNHGVCAEINGGYVCNCTLGFRGPVCLDIDRCTPNPCQHGASCQEINGGVGYVCQCPVGYKGQVCDLKDPCNPSPCLNSGSCSETIIGSGYQCKCQQGWMGSRCGDHDPCYPNPCEHNSICLNDGKNAFKCNCTQGFKGIKCDKIDLCSPNPCRFGSHCIQTDEESYQCVKNLCTPNPCKHEGKCIVVNDEGFECACHNGWRGRNCEDFDPCFSNPCLNGGTCSENSNGGFSCLCSKDFSGKYCGDSKAKAKAEARWCTSNPCTNGGTCIETDGSYNCRCPIGFSGTICEESVCSPNPCENGGLCVPYYGIALCKCTHEYTGAHCSEKRRSDPSVKEKSPTAQYNYVPMPPAAATGSGRSMPSNIVNLPSLSNAARAASVSFGPPSFLQPQVGVISTLAALQGPSVAAINPQLLAAPAPPASLPAKGVTRNTINTNTLSTAMIKKDESCVPSPCQHNGMCVMRTDNTPECVCTNEFSGPHCEEIGTYGYSSAPKFFPKDECNHCDENAICVNSHCICKDGYVGDGLECWAESSKDKEWSCDRNPCMNGGTCKYGRSRCVCKLGFTGDYCQNYCPPLVHLSFDKMRGALAVDESGNNNDAMLINGAEIVYEGGKCDSGVSLLGGDILFDGERFWPKPVEAVTIALWIKLDTNKGIQSIFDTIGQKFSNHKEGQYHVEIENGKVRWFHRNEQHKVVFSIMSQPLVGENVWHHIAGTYDAQKSIARLFLDGDLVAKGTGNGYLSQDWTGKAGIGKHEHPYGDRLLRGMVDEFFIFGCALPRLEVLVLMHHCKLYFGKKKDYSKAQQVPITAPLPIANVNKPGRLHNMTIPADHWVYSVGENIHINADTRAGIGKPNLGLNTAKPRQQQQQQRQQQPYLQQGMMRTTNQKQQPQKLQQQQPIQPYKTPFAATDMRQYQPVGKSQPNAANSPSSATSGFKDFKALWEAWKAKKRAEDAAKKSLTDEGRKIEEVYQSLFGNKNAQQSAPKPQNSNFVSPATQKVEPPSQKSAVASYNDPFKYQQQIQNYDQRGIYGQQVSNYLPYTQNNGNGNGWNYQSNYQKKDFAGRFKAESPSYVTGNMKSAVPVPMGPRRPNPKNSFVQQPRMRNQVAPGQAIVNNNPRSPFYRNSIGNNGINFAAQQTRNQMPNDIKSQLQRMRQIYASKRTQHPPVAKSAAPKPNYNLLRGEWPEPNSVREFATNRGIVRIKSVIKPLVNGRQAQASGARANLERKNQMAQSHYQNPWATYNLLKSQLSSKRDNYRQADSHALSSTTSNTWEGATAPGQKGAGHNYGYGYGYGTGDTLKGGGWGQGFGGGGPGVNKAGNHHTPDFDNKNTQWGQGQGWGQGGKGVPQREEYKPAPPSGSLLPKPGRQAHAPVRHIVQNAQWSNPSRRNGAPLLAPKGPSIMNFNPAVHPALQKQGLYLRGGTPVSSPAYQVKYFMNDRNMDYQNDPARTMRNEIISNAVADVLKSMGKKKKKRTTKSE
eukprot:gene8194-14126_t